MSDGSLKPCPWCNGRAKNRSRNTGPTRSRGRQRWQVVCNACHGRGPLCETPDEAVAKWNAAYGRQSEHRDLEAAASRAVDTGSLAECNRVVLHPVGLCLVFDKCTETDAFLGVRLESASDLEGMCFADEALPTVAARRASYVAELARRAPARLVALGYVVQPAPPDIQASP